MKWFAAGRAIISAAAAVLLVVFALWLWPRADGLAAAIASSSMITTSIATDHLVMAVEAIAIAAAAGGQALLLREVVPMFYDRRWMDELLHAMAGLIVVGGLLAGLVLLVQNG